MDSGSFFPCVVGPRYRRFRAVSKTPVSCPPILIPLHGLPNLRDAVMPFPSVIVTVWPAAVFEREVICPLGQRRSMAVAVACCPEAEGSTHYTAEKLAEAQASRCVLR